LKIFGFVLFNHIDYLNSAIEDSIKEKYNIEENSTDVALNGENGSSLTPQENIEEMVKVHEISPGVKI